MSKAEKFIQLNTKKYSNETRLTIGRHSHWEKQPWLTPEQALAAVEIAREETIDKACEFIDKKVNFYRYHYVGVEHECDMVDTRKLVEDLKKAMEEQVMIEEELYREYQRSVIRTVRGEPAISFYTWLRNIGAL